MGRRCSTCKHCVVDMKALQMGLIVFKCRKKGHYMNCTFWRGWRCKEWRKEDGK